MKSNRSSLLYVLLAVIFSLLLPGVATAAKKKNQNIQPIISAVSNDGSDKIYGSVLNPKEDEINVLLQSLLYILKKGDLSKLSFVLHSALDSSKSYTIPKDAISIQRKKLNKKYDKYLVVNLFNLKTPAGISVSPSSLPKDNYKLRLISSDSEIVSNPINYETPILIVGNSKKSGLVTVEDENGNNLSEHTVATNSDGIFFTEVRANKLSSQNESRRFLKSQDINNENTADTSSSEQTSEIKTGFVHVTADKDLYAVVPLDNDAKNNDSKAKKPIEVDEGSTLAANLAKNNKDLADEVAKDELASIESEEETPVITEPEDINCDISKFANRCKNADDIIYTSVGTDFREFLENNTCDLSEWQLIKQVILASPESTNIYTGKGYCEYIEREINDNKPCEKYSQVLADYKSGLIKQLPCPPNSCNEFSYIKPPRCFTNEGFCNENSPTNDEFGLGGICRGQDCLRPNTKTCIHKPIKDLFCAKIGDIDPSECKDDPSSGLAPVGWTIATNSFGNQYCVSPTYQYSYSKSLTLQEIADLCELNTCHNNCSKQFGAVQPGIVQKNNEELTDCHLTCEANAGRYFDCTKSQSKFFSIKCCYNTTSQQGPPIQFNSSDFGPQKGPIPLDIRSCLCESPSNFNKNGLVNENAQYDCKDKCPQGYEKDPNSDSCLPVCREGTVRDPVGVCRKKCPEGSFDDGTGYCRCPEGQSVGASGKCEVPTCPAYCKNYVASGFGSTPNNYSPTPYGTSSTPGYTSPGYTPSSYSSGYNPQTPVGSTYQIPPECQKCLGGGGGPGSCGPNSKYDPATHQCVPTTQCGPNQYADSTGACKCPDGTLATSLGPEGCKNQNNICGNSNMYPNPNYVQGSNQPSCICPKDLLYWDNNAQQCVAVCPGGNPSPSSIGYMLPGSPIPCSGGGGNTRPCTAGEGPSNGCYCFGGGYSGTDGKCQCAGGIQYTGGGCGTSSTNYCGPNITAGTGNPPCSCPPGATATGINGSCQCTNGQPYNGPASCSSTTRFCTPSEMPNTNNCTCAPGATSTTGITPCICTNGQPYTVSGCGSTSTNYCSPGILISTGCTCNPAGGAYNSNGYCTCPPNSGSYTKETGCTSTSRACNAGEGPSNGCYCFGGGYSGTDGKCQCAGGIQYTGGGCGTSSTNYCGPNITAGTGNPPCSCPPGATATGINGSCQCTNGQPYNGPASCSSTTRFCTPSEMPNTNNCTCAPGATSTTGITPCICTNGQPYTVSGCGSTSTNYCSPGILISTGCTCNPAGGAYNSNGYCTCPSGNNTAYTAATGCSSTSRPCNAGEGPSNGCYCFGGGYTGTDGKCQCAGGIQYTGGGCGTSTSSHVCAAGEAATTTNPCYCAGGATFTGPSGTGTCQCPNNNTPAYTAAGCGSTTTHVCVLGEISNSSNPCTCASGATVGSNGQCQCTNGQIYASGGCPGSTTHTCAPGEANTSSNICTCVGTATFSTANTCQCPSGQTYSTTGCTSTTHTCAPGEANTSSNICTCAGTATFDINNNTCFCPTGSGGGTYSASGCTPPVITLSSVTISSGNVTISYSINSNACVLVKDASNNILKSANLCGVGSFNSVFPTSDFTPALVSGTQVKLCNQNNSSNCSSLVTIP